MSHPRWREYSYRGIHLVGICFLRPLQLATFTVGGRQAPVLPLRPARPSDTDNVIGWLKGRVAAAEVTGPALSEVKL
jgi:hypothetical protein